MDINWENKEIGNMGIRLHPNWCDKGIGTIILSKVLQWCFDNGFTLVKLDVISTNKRAIRCYEKVGFKVKSKFYREDNEFYLMEITQDALCYSV